MKLFLIGLALLLLLCGCARPQGGAPVNPLPDDSAVEAAEAPQAQDPWGEEETVLQVELDRIEAGAAVCLGSLELGGGTLDYRVSAQAGSGLFVALYPEPDVEVYGEVFWNLYGDGSLPLFGDERTVRMTQQDAKEGLYYVYVGSTDTELTGVSGTVSYSVHR